MIIRFNFIILIIFYNLFIDCGIFISVIFDRIILSIHLLQVHVINYNMSKSNFAHNLKAARPCGVKKLAAQRDLARRNNNGSFQKCETR